MFYFFLAISLLGILGMTVFFPVLTVMVSRRQFPFLVKGGSQPNRLLIAIPAHNEERTIGTTLASIREAVASYSHRFPGTEIEILVGLDGCTDGTARLLESFPEVRSIASEKALGKWAMLQRLVSNAGASEWVVFADCGVCWPSSLLIGMNVAFTDPDVVGVNPTYRNPTGGFAERCSWRFESFLKNLESRVGGPISAHGATVAYRVPALRKAFRVLGNRQWFNDDVVIPLTLRTLFPSSRFDYLPTVGVADAREAVERSSAGAEFRRRIRMVAGNAQWMSSFIPRTLKRNPAAGLIAMRRVFRLFWAYWGMFFGASMIGIMALVSFKTALSLVCIGILLICVGLLKSPAVRSLAQAATASLLAPYYLFFVRRGGEVAWR